MDDSKKTVSSRHNSNNEHINSKTTAACTSSDQIRRSPGTGRGKWTQDPIPNQEAICNWYPMAQRKFIFSNGSHWVYQLHTGKDPHSGVGVALQNEYKGILVNSVLFCFVLTSLFCLVGFLLAYFDVHFCGLFCTSVPLFCFNFIVLMREREGKEHKLDK